VGLLNLGILAHVDAGKTSLTERLLYAAGVLDRIGRVDDGTTATDTLALERRRGITIKSAVVSFAVGDVTVNLIDTPGHPDFIAEVERVLSVLDGAVLVISAVEGVQAQTRVLLRALQRLRIPTLIFINKIDRRGAQDGTLLRRIAQTLTPDVVPMVAVRRPGGRDARIVPARPDDTGVAARLLERLAEHDEQLLAAYVDGTPPGAARLRAALVEQTGRALVYPVYVGSAVTGAGIDELVGGLVELLPAAGRDAAGPASGTVFTIRRGPAGERLAYVRMFGGTLRVRDRLRLNTGAVEGRITRIDVVERGGAQPAQELSAGRIGILHGLDEVRIGDTFGAPPGAAAGRQFAPPALQTVVVPRAGTDRTALHLALTRLAEQDPLIDLRQDERRGELALSLYGEVQKEVVQATLADEFGIAVGFRETTPICLERPRGSGAAAELIGVEPNPFLATVGLRVDPAPVGAGVALRLEVELGSMPSAFFTAVRETVHETLSQGLHGWQVTDCTVTITHSGYWARQSHAHGTFDKSMSSTAGDFRHLTPLVLMAALRRAGTVVHEPIHRFELEIPAAALSPVLRALATLRATPQPPRPRGPRYRIDGQIPAARVHELRRLLPGLTSGEGELDSAPAGHRPVTGPIPERPRTDHDPLNRSGYLLHVRRRV